MAITKTVTRIITNSTIGASSYADSTTFIDTADCIGFGVEGICTYSTAATQGLRLQAFGSYDSTGWDDSPFWQADMPFAAATSSQGKTFGFPFDPKYVKIRALNLSTANSVSAVDVYSHVQTA
jgi:hypothetical protein